MGVWKGNNIYCDLFSFASRKFSLAFYVQHVSSIALKNVQAKFCCNIVDFIRYVKYLQNSNIFLFIRLEGALSNTKNIFFQQVSIMFW